MDFDSAWFARIAEGDDSAWDSFFRQHDVTIRRVVSWSKWRFSSSVRDDVAHVIRAELVRCLPRRELPADLTAFIKRICVRRCIDEVRRQIRARGVEVPLVGQGEDGEEYARPLPADERYDPVVAIVTDERGKLVKQLVGQLGDTCRDAITRFYLENRSYKEIAAQLGIAVNTVGSRLAKCLAKLRGLMDTYPVLRETLL